MVEHILTTLIINKNNPEPLNEEEKLCLRIYFAEKLIAGWKISEIIELGQNLEYFNIKDSEEICLQKINNIYKKVENRLRKS